MRPGFYFCCMRSAFRQVWHRYKWLLLPYGIYLPVAIGGLWWASFHAQAWVVGVLAAGGAFFWTFVEYLLHRWGFHEPPGGPLAKKHDIHWGHHAHPHAPDRIVTRPLQSLPLAIVFLGLFWLIGWGHPLVWAFYAGFGLGYLGYETLHLLMHVHPQPPVRFLRRLWRHHHWHHFRAEEKYFGVTTRLWDRVFGTV